MITHTTEQKSRVLDTPAANSQEAQAYFLRKLNCETDPADVYADVREGVADFVFVDVRTPQDFARSHAVGAINIPQPAISAETTAHLSKEKLVVVYCWGPGCNGATKAALRDDRRHAHSADRLQLGYRFTPDSVIEPAGMRKTRDETTTAVDAQVPRALHGPAAVQT